MTPEQYCQDKAARSGSSFYYSFLFLPAEHDPDSYVREFGAEAFEQCVAQAVPLSRQLVEAARADLDTATAEGRARLAAGDQLAEEEDDDPKAAALYRDPKQPATATPGRVPGRVHGAVLVERDRYAIEGGGFLCRDDALPPPSDPWRCAWHDADGVPHGGEGREPAAECLELATIIVPCGRERLDRSRHRARIPLA